MLIPVCGLVAKTNQFLLQSCCDVMGDDALCSGGKEVAAIPDLYGVRKSPRSTDFSEGAGYFWFGDPLYMLSTVPACISIKVTALKGEFVYLPANL